MVHSDLQKILQFTFLKSKLFQALVSMIASTLFNDTVDHQKSHHQTGAFDEIPNTALQLLECNSCWVPNLNNSVFFTKLVLEL